VKKIAAVVLGIAALSWTGGALVFAQHSPAPDRPAESGLKTNRGGQVPPAGSDGTRFNPNPPPPLPGTVETPPGGKVKTEEKIGTPVPGTPSPAGATPAPTMNPKMTPTPMGQTTPARRALTKKPSVRPRMTPTPKAS
jgi:hypothetical protein